MVGGYSPIKDVINLDDSLKQIDQYLRDNYDDLNGLDLVAG